jgi:hypothetical protein
VPFSVALPYTFVSIVQFTSDQKSVFDRAEIHVVAVRRELDARLDAVRCVDKERTQRGVANCVGQSCDLTREFVKRWTIPVCDSH